MAGILLLRTFMAMIWSDRTVRFLSVCLFAGAFAWLWYLRGHTGVPWDEPWQQNLGVKSWDFATGRNEALLSIQNRYHGGGVETLSEGICRAAGVYSFAGKVGVRRTVIICIFLCGAWFLWSAAARMTGKKIWGLAAAAMLFFTPRIMVHAAVNSKDLPLLSVAAFFLWCCVRFRHRPGLLRACWCGVGAGAMVALRIPAVYVLFLWIFLWGCTYPPADVPKRRWAGMLPLFLTVSVLSTYVFWPVLWGGPFIRFAEAWAFMSRFPWENEVLFMGRFIPAQNLPPAYIPVWIGITVPLLWSLLFLGGALTAAFRFFKKPRTYGLPVFLAGFVAAPVAAVVLMHSVVYDEWRHLFFVYPALILTGVWWLDDIGTRVNRRVFATAVLCLFALQSGEVAAWCAANPRFTYLYLNPAARFLPCGTFEGDYWGLSYREANRFLLDTYDGTPLRIRYVHLPGLYNHWALPDADREKLRIVPYHEADYLITNHRFEKESFNFGDVVFEERVDGCAVITVYKKIR